MATDWFQTETYSEPSQTSRVEILAQEVNGFQRLTNFAKSYVLYLALSIIYRSFTG